MKPDFVRPLLTPCFSACLAMAVLWGSVLNLPLHAADPLFETTQVFPALPPKNKPNYRIPSLVVMQNQDLLAIMERRNDGIGDVGNHDIVMKRSRDLGKTWSEEILILDDGEQTCTDITLCYDRQKNVLFLMFLKDKKKFAYLRTDDNGTTWKGPTVVHESVTKPEWDTLGMNAVGSAPDTTVDAESGGGSKAAVWKKNWTQRYGLGPGNAGIQLTKGPHAGRLLVPARHRFETDGKYRSITHNIYSDDHGATWKLADNGLISGSETMLVELANGDVLASMRDESGEFAPDRMKQLFSTSADGGITWTPFRRVDELITPRVHASIKRYSLAETADKNRLLFSNPAYPVRTKGHPYGRYNMTVRLSYDEGATWTAGKTIYPDTCSYSDMAVLPDGTIGLIYERGPKDSVNYWDEMQFARFNLEWLTESQDTTPAKN